MNFNSRELELLQQHAKGGAEILVSTHIHPDPDAIGSVLAASEILSSMGAAPIIVLHDDVPIRCRILPGSEHVVHFPKRAPDSVYNTAVILDAGGLSRIGDVQSLLTKDAVIFNIDHHLSNDRFGRVNWVDLESSATAELIYLLCGALGISITPSLAANLLAGILTDTGRFRYTNTTPRVFRIAADLVEAGADVTGITNNMYFDIPAADVLSMGAVYSTLELFEDDQLSTMFVRLEHLVEDPDSVVDLALSIRGVHVAALLSETTEGKVRVSLRSRRYVNVAAIAESLGGGGHEKAAGFRMKGSLESVRERLLPILENAIRTGAESQRG